ncbi:DUF3014 domain-containing protein [Shewanella surugensis]|uniref:DUF3014 domain-containing protein n=1 Tax=Shewanella surugensis TaxID=212020 RepID=A0ABT0LA64_9GAMM|nr:DUF3014 domain-containing protein [Shewanella surugensis]MCL1124607.1 DUF3014 domain-containing protein [Shewanella surugensis]
MKANQEDRANPKGNSSGSNPAIIFIIIVILLAGGAYYYFSQQDGKIENSAETDIIQPVSTPDEPLDTVAKVPETSTTILNSDTTAETTPHTPIQPEILPPLNTSDQFAYQKALDIADGMTIQPILNDKNIIRQFVVFVDNLSEGELARNASPIKGPKEKFTVADVSNKTYIDPDSYHRYDIYADFLSGLNEQQLLSTYKQMSPLFSEALAELGYKDTSFDERMLKAIDLMMATPVINDPIEVNGISVNYKFVDPKLEVLAGPQKLLIRMGADNARKVKAALRRLKTQLIQQENN